MVVNNEDYYYLPGVARAIKDILGREDLLKDDVPEVLVALGYDYDENTIPYQTHGKTISLYKKTSISELLNVPGNRYKAIQIISKIVARHKGVNVFAAKPIIGRTHPNRKNNLTMRESAQENTRHSLNESLRFVDTLNESQIIGKISTIYINNNNDKEFIVYSKPSYYKIGPIKGSCDEIGIGVDEAMDNCADGIEKSFNKINIKPDIICNYINGIIVCRLPKEYDGKYNHMVDAWMKEKMFDRVESLDNIHILKYVYRTFEHKDNKPSFLDDYSDITTIIMPYIINMDNDAIKNDIAAIYNHVINKDTVYEMYNNFKAPKDAVSKHGTIPIGELEKEISLPAYERFVFDARMKNQFLKSSTLIPGKYKIMYKNKPCTLWVGKTITNHGYVYYDDDKNAEVYASEHVNG